MRPSDHNDLKSIYTVSHDGHTLRTGRRIVDRAKLSAAEALPSCAAKRPNQYTGHTFLTRKEQFRLDGHKLFYHLDRVLAWQRGERIAPIHIDMGLTKFCNMACLYCIGVTQGMEKGVMIQRGALLRFIADCGRLGVRSIGFIGDGEPALNPALYDALARARGCGISCGIATNGLALDTRRAESLLANAAFIRFNLSAAGPKSFRRVHQINAGYFQAVIEKIKTLVRIKREKKMPCTLGLQMVLIPENFDQILGLGRLGKSLGVDYLQIKQCSDTEYKELGINHKDYLPAAKDLAKVEKLTGPGYLVKVKWNKIHMAKETDIYKKGFRKYDICYGTPFLGQISGNGKVYPCGPFFGKERFCMGDIHEQSYYDIVRGRRYWQVQKDVIEHVDVHYDCTVGCRQDYINKFLWELKNPPQHIDFI